MTDAISLPTFDATDVVGHRLINAKFPPIEIFDDVASPEDFEALYAIQALTNPRLQNEVGDLSLVALEDIPFGVKGCHYAAASFTHVNPDGSRFSDGTFGIMYVADSTETAIAEVMFHQEVYWRNVPDLHYDRLVFKALRCSFDVEQGLDATGLATNDPLYHQSDYTAARALGNKVRLSNAHTAIKYRSVRRSQGECHALFTPKAMTEIIQTAHYEMIWSEGAIQSVTSLTSMGMPT